MSLTTILIIYGLTYSLNNFFEFFFENQLRRATRQHSKWKKQLFQSMMLFRRENLEDKDIEYIKKLYQEKIANLVADITSTIVYWPDLTNNEIGDVNCVILTEFNENKKAIGTKCSQLIEEHPIKDIEDRDILIKNIQLQIEIINNNIAILEPSLIRFRQFKIWQNA